MKSQMQLIDALQLLGVDFALDYDDELLVTYPLLPIQTADLAALVEDQREPFLFILQRRREQLHSIYHGGPLHGKRHGGILCPCWRSCIHLARARWAVYEASENYKDRRLYFRGVATSRAKCRRGQFVPQRAEGRP